MGALDDASHRVGEQSGAGERKVSGPPGLIVPYYTARGDYIRIRITKAWELRAGLGNPNRVSTRRATGEPGKCLRARTERNCAYSLS